MKEYTILNRSLVSFEDGDIKTAIAEHYQYEIDDYWIIKEDGISYVFFQKRGKTRKTYYYC